MAIEPGTTAVILLCTSCYGSINYVLLGETIVRIKQELGAHLIMKDT